MRKKIIPDASPSPPNQLLRQNPIHPISLNQAQNLGGAMGDNNMDVDIWDQAAAAQLDGDQAENPPENPQEAVQIPPAHPQFPQDMIDVNHSSMRPLRATGHDIPFERVFGFGSSDEDSSSSIDATSEPVLLNKENLQFVAAQSICLDRLVFDRRALPDGFQLQGPAALFQQPDI